MAAVTGGGVLNPFWVIPAGEELQGGGLDSEPTDQADGGRDGRQRPELMSINAALFNLLDA